MFVEDKNMAISVPEYDGVTLEQMYDDPYPTYATLRKEAPVAWLKPANIHVVTKYEDIMQVERDQETFPSYDNRSLMIKVMGHTLMRRDGDDHKRHRKSLERTFSPVSVKKHWKPIFERIADEIIDDLYDKGQADIFADFAAPYASRCLKEVIGLPNMDWQDLSTWSQAFMDGVGNYGNDPETWARAKAAFEGIDNAIEDHYDGLKANPDYSALSSMFEVEDPIDMADIRANIKVIVGGGLNEPRDVTCTIVYALLTNPDQLKKFLANPALYKTIFEEAVRWVSPIGMYPRKVSKRVEIGGAILDEGDALGLVVASANRDSDRFENADKFDIDREKMAHIGFGAGPHFCAGTWVARAQVGEIAIPKLFERLPNLRLDPERESKFGGWVFRGPLSVPVVWDA